VQGPFGEHRYAILSTVLRSLKEADRNLVNPCEFRQLYKIHSPLTRFAFRDERLMLVEERGNIGLSEARRPTRFL
jgi:hypothetical protein